jgi:predicted RNase H-like nuclease (RuvC/YqgF family)
MKKQHLGARALSTLLSVILGTTLVVSAQADPTLDNILKEGQAMTTNGAQSQKRIDKLQEETDDLYREFKSVSKEIEGLRVYNRQLQKQIDDQVKVINQLTSSIDQVTVIERQVQPLILRMLDALEQFIELDSPFLLEERQNRVANLYENLDRADLSVAEKFRQVLEAYRIESEYGRSLIAYEDTQNIAGADLQVNVLVFGRVALLYQSKDKKLNGVWDRRNKTWQEVDAGTYANSIFQAIKIARGEAPFEIVKLPIPAPEAAQ